jgi:hypothetical protein
MVFIVTGFVAANDPIAAYRFCTGRRDNPAILFFTLSGTTVSARDVVVVTFFVRSPVTISALEFGA